MSNLMAPYYKRIQRTGDVSSARDLIPCDGVRAQILRQPWILRKRENFMSAVDGARVLRITMFGCRWMDVGCLCSLIWVMIVSHQTQDDFRDAIV
jgi:hypothetical protein